MAVTFSIDALARLSGEPVDRLREWRNLGLLGSAATEVFAPDDVVRVRLVRLLLHHGMDLDAVAAWARSSESVLDAALVASRGAVAYSPAEAAGRLGVPPATLDRLLSATGWTSSAPLDDEDLEALRVWKIALDAGFPEEAMVQFVRVLRDVMRRVADTQAQLLHVDIRRRLQALGLTGGALAAAVEKAVDELLGPVRSALLYFYRLALREAVEETAVLQAAEEAGLRRVTDVPGQVEVAVVFVDLASSTSLADAMGDLKMAEVLDRFSILVREAAARTNGHVIKQIGDAFMLTFHVPDTAVVCALDIEAAAGGEPHFPAVRAGVHWGDALYREGDYVGTTVNVAARLADEAGRHQVLVSGSARRAVRDPGSVEFVPLGSRHLRGVSRAVELFEARREAAGRRARAIDVVCGMELGPGEVRARLARGARERVFCSDECLQRYASAPERYETA